MASPAMTKSSSVVVVDYRAIAPDRLAQIFDVNRSKSKSDLLGLAAAAVLQATIIALVVTVINVDILFPWSAWTERTRLIYTTGTTILATLVTTLTVSSIRKSWFGRVSHVDTSSRNGNGEGKVQAQMRTLIGLAGWSEQITAWPVFLAFIIVGLATTVIVVALTPRATSVIDRGSPGRICTSTGRFCTNEIARRSTAGQLFSWILADGTSIGLDQNITEYRGYCSPRPAINLLTTGIGQILPSNAAYVIQDTLITQSAIGMPWDTDLLSYVFGAQRTPEFQWTTRCLPILLRNPVKCKQAGTVAISDTNRTLTVTNGDCVVTSNTLRVQPSSNAAAAMGACTKNNEVGTATLLFGAVDEVIGYEGNGLAMRDGSYAQQLKDAVNASGIDGREFSAACTVDVPSAMGLRMLNYSRVDDLKAPVSVNVEDKSQPAHRSGYGYQVAAVSNETCKMLDFSTDKEITLEQLQYPGLLATAAGASWSLLVQNSFDDGYFDTLMYMAGLTNRLHGGDPFATRLGVFPDSKTSLEDALGAVTAATMGIEFLDCSADHTFLETAPQSYSTTRLGPSSPLSYLYLLPSIFTMGLLGWLFWGSLRTRSKR